MILDDSESDLLKKWVIKKLESISDADSDVLADYVVALAKTDDPEPAAKANCIENLKDFLVDNTEPFVDQLFHAISTKSFDPNQPPPKPAAPTYQPPKRTSIEQPRFSIESRKRSYHDWDRDEQAHSNGRIQSYDGGDRPMKQPRRGGRGHDQRGGGQPPQQYGMPQMPAPFPGMPPIDPNNPMATLFAMQQALGLFPGLPNGTPTAQRCRDYDTKGFCAAGMSCPYGHGNDPVVIPGMNQEYGPNNASLLNIAPSRTGHLNLSQNNRGRGDFRGRGRGANNFRGGGKRSIISHLGPTRDLSNTTIVVESIPQDKCDEQMMRDFFSEFGNIDEVTVQPDKKLAIIKYDDHAAAQAAYESPKVVFDNRFVKVFWHKTDRQLNPMAGSSHVNMDRKASNDVEMQDDNQTDPVELAKQQEEAQRKHDEAKKQREEMAKQRLELDAQLKAKEEERRKMADLIARKTGKAQSPQAEAGSENGVVESEQTKGLKAQLAKLEAEAKSLGLNPDEMTNGISSPTSFRGRGGFRGRPRGRGHYPSYRGGWAGGRGGAVMRLDNRPKTVAVTFPDGSYNTHEEALRQFLLFNNLDSATLTNHPDRDDTALVAFNQRFEGENFMAAATNSELLHIGKVELAWYKPDNNAAATNGTHDSDTKMAQTETTEQPSRENENYEMAEDENLDHWS